MIVVYCANRKLYKHLLTSINSLLMNNPDVDKIYLLVEDDEVEFLRHPKVSFINVNDFDFIIREGINCNNKFTYMALARCALTKILSEDKILYLDVDTIVDGDISELWNFPLQGNCIAARAENDTEDISNRGVSRGYFNSGVLLMNLKLMRALRIDDELLRLLKCCRFVFPDQDAMNVVLKNNVSYLPHKFNAIGSKHVYSEDLVIRHFAGFAKPWMENAAQEDKIFWNRYVVDKL